MNQIAVIDFDNFHSEDSYKKQKLAQEFLEAIQKHGFAYIKNFGINHDQVNQMFEKSHQFFQASKEIKQSGGKDHANFCGYDEIESEKISSTQPADLKESFNVKRNGTPWPECNFSKNFESVMLDFHARCHSASFQIIKYLALGLNIDENSFASNFSLCCTECNLRLLHYPPIIKPILSNQLRCGEHTDYGGLTLLFQDPAGGLEIKTKQGDWIPAPYMPDTAVINIGDSMEMWTNGYLKSTPHRVKNPKGQGMSLSRYSTAFFFDPDLNSELKSLDKFKDLKDTRFTSKTYKEHVSRIFNESYPKSGFDFVKGVAK